MPLYDFDCSNGHRFERFVKLIHFEDPQLCACNASATRVISLPMISVENVGYDCPITGKWIGSKADHSENLKLHGCRVFEPGEKEASVQAKAKIEADFESRLDETVERTIENFSSEKKESLANELLGGVDLAVERS